MCSMSKANGTGSMKWVGVVSGRKSLEEERKERGKRKETAQQQQRERRRTRKMKLVREVQGMGKAIAENVSGFLLYLKDLEK